MSFCASCGRQRSGTTRFCGDCGAEFSEPAADLDAQEPPSHDATGLDVDPGVTRVEPPAAQTDPFASWYQQEAPAVRQGADSNWQPTRTVQATPTQAPGHLPPSYPPPVPPPPHFPPGPPASPPTRSSGGKGLFIAVAVVVVLAAGGGAYALATSLGKHQSAQSATPPAASASTPAAGTSPATGSSAAPSTTGSSPTASPTLSLVAISPDVQAGTAEPHVETLLSHYFNGINTHSYQEYASTLNAAQQAKQSQSQFESGYSSTTDSGMTLTSLSDSGNGGLTATVTFTSRQSASQSVDNSACNAWTLNLYLVPQGSGYLIGPAPAGYQPNYSDC
jgi:hypothetical protein